MKSTKRLLREMYLVLIYMWYEDGFDLAACLPRALPLEIFKKRHKGATLSLSIIHSQCPLSTLAFP